jgi:predicted nucleotidyltransferase
MPQPITLSVRIPIEYDRLAEFCHRRHIDELGLFGSVLRDDFRADSDVDVLVTFASDAQIDLFDFVQVQDELRALFGRDVDLVEKDAISNPFRRHAVLSSYRVIYASAGP